MDYDPLRERVKNARTHLQGRIFKAKQDLAEAKTRLAVLEDLELTLNLDAIVDLLPEEESDPA